MKQRLIAAALLALLASSPTFADTLSPVTPLINGLPGFTVSNPGNVTGGGGGGGGTPATHAQSSVLASNLVVKAASGDLISFQASADSTLSAAAWWLMIFDATSLPANGTVTPAKCYAVPSGTTSYSGSFVAPGEAYTTGIVMGVSTTGCFSLTASVHAFFGAGFN